MNKLQFIVAAAEFDWKQVVSNGGPPCFHMESDGHFCGRAQAWEGHASVHPFASLAHLLAFMADGMPAMERCELMDGDVVVLRCPGPVAAEMAERLKEHVEAYFRGHKCLVLGDGIEMTIMEGA